MNRLPIDFAHDRLGVLSRDLSAELEKPGMTIRTMALVTGVDKSTILRAKQHRPTSAAAYIALSSWLQDQQAQP
ncbi:MAG: hypothetical protein ACOH2M_31895 [Cypionkella sp.]